VKTVEECVEVYQTGLKDITAGGWDQAKYQILLDWYLAKLAQLNSASATTTDTDTLKEGLAGKLSELIF
jgi:hypothetical protein